MKALIWSRGAARIVEDRPQPALRDDYILIKTAAVALNPTDTKAIDQGRAAEGGLIGCNFAGVVLEVGSKCHKKWNKGDRIFGCAHGSNSNNSEDGAFAEIITAKGDTCIRIPDSMSFEDAASVAVSAITVGQGVYEELKLAWPDTPIVDPQYMLIYGGSSSTGTLAIQYARLSGYTVITTCSARNFALVKSRGAAAAFDYTDPDCARKIFEFTHGTLSLVWDTIGSPGGIDICMQALSKSPGTKYGTILFNSIPRQNVQYSSSFLVEFLGEAFDKFGTHHPAVPARFEFAKKFTALTEQLLAEGKLVPHPVKVCAGGLEGILEGVKIMLDKGISGEKLIYQVNASS